MFMATSLKGHSQALTSLTRMVTWNYIHMMLQVENVIDVLAVKFHMFQFLLFADHSSGLSKKQHLDGLKACYTPNSQHFRKKEEILGHLSIFYNLTRSNI
jgi:hypothetical protein